MISTHQGGLGRGHFHLRTWGQDSIRLVWEPFSTLFAVINRRTAGWYENLFNTSEHFLQGLIESSVLSKPIQGLNYISPGCWGGWRPDSDWGLCGRLPSLGLKHSKTVLVRISSNISSSEKQVVPSVPGRQGNLDAVSEEEEKMEQEDSDDPDFIVIDIDWKPLLSSAV